MNIKKYGKEIFTHLGKIYCKKYNLGLAVFEKDFQYQKKKKFKLI